MSKTYRLRPDTAESVIEGYSPLLSQLLHQREAMDREAAVNFIEPNYDDLSDPFTMHQMQQGIDRVVVALKQNEKITIYADYDADGVPGAAVLYKTLQNIGYENFDVYIPHRHNEGFGLHREALDTLAENGTQLIVTIDLGTSAVPEIVHANTLGMDVVVTDHHLPAAELPDAVAIVNPKLGDYADPMLCGSGVMFQFVRALLQHLRENPIDGLEVPQEGWEKWLLDLVGIATISDMVPLVKENRILAHYGLLVLRKTKNLGLQTLMQRGKVSQRFANETDVGFSISPRINAASRMDHPMRAFELLVATDPVEAQSLAEHLLKINDERKKQVATIMRSVHKRLAKRDLRQVVVIGDTGWGHGVVGLVAAKITDEYGVTCFVWSEHHSGVLKGSCRAATGVNVTELMAALPKETFQQFGGHAGAGGFTLAREYIHTLEEALIQEVEKLNLESIEEVVEVDAVLDTSSVHKQLHNELRLLAPFGFGNPEPVFAIRGKLSRIGTFGKAGVHLEVVLDTGLRAISWYRQPEDLSVLPEEGEECLVIGSLEESRFMGKVELRLKLVDVVKSLD